MRKIETEVLVIGGGATGTGTARDAAMRGFKTVLVEKSDLSTGTSGRFHGLLHSGGRYAVKDPHAARECIEENRILRRIMPHCIEDTGGFFVVTPWDDPTYVPRFIQSCEHAGIQVEEVLIPEMLRQEPLLNPRITHCLRVPDASADSFLGAQLNARSVRDYGGRVFNYTRLVTLRKSGSRVTGALCRDLVKDEELEITADMVVNAAGAWCGQITGTAGIPVKIIPGKGVMLAANHRIVNTVINRCKLPSDGDILVPAHTVAVMGTTDTPVEDPEDLAIEPWEVQLMLEEGEKLVPGFRDMRILRAWAGVRPLYQETQAAANRDVTRAFVLLDHEPRDGMSGLVTITSGKWTTYRKMAEVTIDLVCRKLGVQRECKTAHEPLPGNGERAAKGPTSGGHSSGYHHLGARLAKVEKEHGYGSLLCECELATYDDVKRAILEGQAKTIDDIRRAVRLGMGPCQGGFCTLRAAGMLYELRSARDLRRQDVNEANQALLDFLQERWKGLLPILWGQQLRQERLDELIYIDVLNAGWLRGDRPPPSPGGQPSSVVENSFPLKEPRPQVAVNNPSATTTGPASAGGQTQDVLVIGAGLAGLVAAWQAAANGQRTRLVSKGMGSIFWSAGCIEVLGFYPHDAAQPLESPAECIKRLVKDNSRHPYALAGMPALEQALAALQALCAEAGYPLAGSLDGNWLLPSALGTPRPVCLAPESMVSGDLRKKDPVLVVGFEGFGDFFPHWMAANLQERGIQAKGVLVDLPVLRERRLTTARTLAAAFDMPDFRAQVAGEVRARLPGAFPSNASLRVAFPAVLGWDHAGQAWNDMQEKLGVPVFEAPTLPPSIPGIRLHNLLVSAFKAAGGRFYDGMQAQGAEADGEVAAVFTEAAARRLEHRARTYILATGGILGGGIIARNEGGLQETVFGLPVAAPAHRSGWFHPAFLSTAGHAVYRAGLRVDSALRPLDETGQPAYSNLYAAGAVLGDWDPLHERSLEGAALAAAWRAAQLACGKVNE